MRGRRGWWIFGWDLATGNIVATAKSRRHQGYQVRWHGENAGVSYRGLPIYYRWDRYIVLLVVVAADGPINCEKIPSRVQRNYTCAAWTDDYEMVLVGSESGDFVYCMFPDKKNISVCDSVSACAGGVHSICASGTLADDTVEVTVGGGDGTVTIYKRDRRGFIDDAAVTLEGQVMSLSKSADGAEILAGTKSGFVYRLRTQGLAALLLAETHSASVTAVAYAPNVSEKFVTASADGTLRIWDAPTTLSASLLCWRRWRLLAWRCS